jgi:hypothetical protein
LEEVLFNEGCKVNEIHTGTFENCMKLETINLWCRVNNIHKDAFKNCFSLQEFNGSYVSYFHDYAFTNCTNLREVKLDIGNVLKISCDTFSGCICQMLKLTFDDDMEALLSQLPNNSILVTISRCDGFYVENREIFGEGEHAQKIENYENTHLGLLQKTHSVSH